MVTFYRAGHSLREVAETFTESKSTVQRWVKFASGQRVRAEAAVLTARGRLPGETTITLAFPERRTTGDSRSNKHNGLFHKGSCYNFNAITDGTSNTILLLERTAATKT
jgi:hypothetical protein